MFLPKVGKPIVPIPYGNNAKSADLASGTTTISMDGGNSVAIKGSTFSKSTGDAGGAGQLALREPAGTPRGAAAQRHAVGKAAERRDGVELVVRGEPGGASSRVGGRGGGATAAERWHTRRGAH